MDMSEQHFNDTMIQYYDWRKYPMKESSGCTNEKICIGKARLFAYMIIGL